MTSTNSKYNGLKSYIENQFEVSVNDEELEDIMAIALKQDGYESNKGYKWQRVNDNPSEMAFYEQWLKENEPNSWINNGHGILQDLFIERSNDVFQQRKWITEITTRDRMIVATVIQWLGSNCGMSFLDEALKRFNHTIVKF